MNYSAFGEKSGRVIPRKPTIEIRKSGEKYGIVHTVTSAKGKETV